MFGKLVKYELRSSGRTLLPIWCAVLVLSAANAVLFSRPSFFESGSRIAMLLTSILPLVLFALWVAMGVLTLIFVIQRFYSGLLKSEGYLMFTLPVRVSSLIGSRLLTATVMELAGSLVGILGIMILLIGQNGINLTVNLGDLLRAIKLEPQAARWGIAALVELVVLGLLSVIEGNLRIYMSIALGHLSRRRRGVLALGAFIGLCIIISVLNVWAASFSMQILPLSWIDWLTNASWANYALPSLALGLLILRALVLCAVWWLGTQRILTRRLNLE